jgi:diguanylate cyclase (GGDEF)-like protein
MTEPPPARLAVMTGDQLQALADPAFATDADGVIAAWNGAATELLGHTVRRAVRTRCAVLLEGVGPQGVPVCARPCPMLHGLVPRRRIARERPGAPRHPDLLVRNARGDRVSLSVLTVPVTLDGVPMLLHLLRDQPLTERDPLTGALSRDAFAVRALDERNRSARSGSPLALALVDLDALKAINDLHGHAAGDRALVAVAQVLRTGRRTDLVGRWGGDEFAVLMPDTPADKAVARMRRTLGALERSASTAGSRLTFSAGVVTTDPEMPLGVIMERADAAMYGAKRAGRGCVHPYRAAEDQTKEVRRNVQQPIEARIH